MTQQRHRERVVSTPAEIPLGTNYIWNKYTEASLGESERVLDTIAQGRRYYLSEECGDELHPGPPYKTGGPFNKWDLEDGGLVLQNEGFRSFIFGYRRYEYDGGFVCSESPESVHDLGPTDFENLSSLDFGNVAGYGAEAWNKFKPGQPTSGLAVAIGELREVPRMLKTSAFAFHNAYKAMRSGALTGGKMSSSAANHYLNTQFGWKPFLRDLVSFYDTCNNLDGQVEQLKRDQGQWVKRGGTVAEVEDTVREDTYNATRHYPLMPSTWHNYPTGSSKITVKMFQKVWFSGRFRYVMPFLNGPGSNWRSKAYLLGANVSPSTVWNLTPWSWLVDWFTNAGDVIANWETKDTIAAKYAYVMGTTRFVGTVTSEYNLKSGPIFAEWTYPLNRKSRVVASPFGFSLEPSAFSGFQWSILSALGLSRLR